MGNKVKSHIFLIFFVVIFCNTLFATNYYIDNTVGNDSNTGTSTTAPWLSFANINNTVFQPGDSILFRAGQSWSGILKPKGSGAKGLPITISKYGKGSRPAINGDQSSNCTVHPGLKKTCAILLYNQEYWVIRDLEITNYSSKEELGKTINEWENDNVTLFANVHHPPQIEEESTNSQKNSILVEANNMGEVNSLHFINLEIHGTNGLNTFPTKTGGKANGGIYICVHNLGEDIPTYYDDILIENCHIHDVDRTGIAFDSDYNDRTLTTNINWTPWTNVIVRNNFFERTGGTGCIFRMAKNGLVEKNTFDHCSIKGSGMGIFNFNTDNAIIQYNECRYTKYNVGDIDFGGLDSDFQTKNTIIQYNYSHNNDGGFLITGGPGDKHFNDSTIVRYNVFLNNGRVNYDPKQNRIDNVLRISGGATNTFIHNNIFYIGEEISKRAIFYHKLWGKRYSDQVTYFNNVIINKGSGNYVELTKSTNNVFTNNAYDGNSINMLPNQQNAIHKNLQSYWQGEDNFRIDKNSPLIGAGINLIEMPKLDYYGNLVNEHKNIGIIQNIKNYKK
ncbi:MAG: hypothetical protein HQ541_20525 [Mariniphaga sp.]|nr:hypothetical protein [Mariniphaga sp.]